MFQTTNQLPFIATSDYQAVDRKKKRKPWVETTPALPARLRQDAMCDDGLIKPGPWLWNFHNRKVMTSGFTSGFTH